MLLEELKTQAQVFFRDLEVDLLHAKIEFERSWDIDHVCYRTPSLARYDDLKRHLSEHTTLLHEAEVNGRPIAVFQLNEPFEFRDCRIDLLELPAPKNGVSTPEGFEHIEIVCGESFADLEARYSGGLSNEKGFTINKKGLAKTFNRELEITLGARNIKFHHLSLLSVIRLESNEKVWRALQETQLLTDFASFDPLVVGTFPLGISTRQSDVDIILYARDLKHIEETLRQKNFTGLKISRQRVNELESVVARFEVDGIPFEVFAQARSTLKQQAYRHFSIEEKLLKYKGPAFKDRIQDLRRQGLKTEPAFAVALQIERDPYRGLLEYERLSPSQLAQS